MILELDDYKKHLPLNALQAYNANITESHEIRALYKWFGKFLGNTMVEEIAEGSEDNELLLRVIPALVNLTYFEALPFLNLVLTGSGFAVMSNQSMAPASTERVKALAVGLLEAAHNFLDSLLSFLEENTATYTDWNQCSLNPGSLLPDVDTFNSRFKINQSRVTFISLIPHIKDTEVLRVANTLSDEFLQELILGSDANVKPLIQTACAFWAWESLVSTTDSTKPEHKNYGRNSVNLGRYGKNYTDSETLHSQKQMLYASYSNTMARKKGEEYMNQAIAYLVKNIDSYLTYKNYAYEAPFENEQENGFYIT